MNDQATMLFDRLRYIDKLKEGGVPDGQARNFADALNEALRDSVATKRDLGVLEASIRADMLALRNEIKISARDVTIRIGGMIVAGVAILIGVKFFG